MLLQFIQSLKSRHTRIAYHRDLTLFTNWVAEQGVDLSAITPRLLDQYRSHLLAHYEPATVNRHLSALRSYIRWLVLNEVLAPSVFQAAQLLPGVAPAKKLPRLLTEQEMEDLLCQPDPLTFDGLRDLVFIRLLLSSGIRLDEAVKLNIEDINLATRSAIVRGKRDKERKIFFDTATEQAIRSYLALRGGAERGSALLINYKGDRINARWLQLRLTKYGQQIGRPDLHPHLLRHTFATQLLDGTGDLRLVQDLLGHADPKTTHRYTALATKRHEQAYRSAMEAILCNQYRPCGSGRWRCSEQ